MSGYWPWWAGALGLSLTFVGFWVVLGRPLGVSSLLGKLLYWKENNRLRADDGAFADQAALRAALREATAAAFGGQAEMAEDGEDAQAELPSVRPSSRENLAFFGFLTLGGTLAALSRGAFSPGCSAGPEYERLFHGSLLPLLLGGVLVGLGTRMAGGCTSGHGLNGCAAAQPASWLATALFFGTGVFASFLLELVLCH